MCFVFFYFDNVMHMYIYIFISLLVCKESVIYLDRDVDSESSAQTKETMKAYCLTIGKPKIGDKKVEFNILNPLLPFLCVRHELRTQIALISE